MSSETLETHLEFKSSDGLTYIDKVKVVTDIFLISIGSWFIWDKLCFLLITIGLFIWGMISALNIDKSIVNIDVLGIRC